MRAKYNCPTILAFLSIPDYNAVEVPLKNNLDRSASIWCGEVMRKIKRLRRVSAKDYNNYTPWKNHRLGQAQDAEEKSPSGC